MSIYTKEGLMKEARPTYRKSTGLYLPLPGYAKPKVGRAWERGRKMRSSSRCRRHNHTITPILRSTGCFVWMFGFADDQQAVSRRSPGSRQTTGTWAYPDIFSPSQSWWRRLATSQVWPGRFEGATVLFHSAVRAISVKVNCKSFRSKHSNK